MTEFLTRLLARVLRAAGYEVRRAARPVTVIDAKRQETILALRAWVAKQKGAT